MAHSCPRPIEPKRGNTGTRAATGITLAGFVTMRQWGPNGNVKSANAHRQVNADWGLVIFYRVEGMAGATPNQIKI